MEKNIMHNLITENNFLYGASCAPYAKSMDWPVKEWGRDLAAMKKMGFTIARIFVPWDRIERREGVDDFSKQDFFMGLAKKHGISVLLNVGGVFDCLQGIYPPPWLARVYQVHATQYDPRITEGHNNSRVCVCLDDEIYREKAFAFIARAVRRYAAHPATAGWMVWNEPGLSPCYCVATAARFRAWLKEKYKGSLDEINRLWGSEFPLEYDSWEQVLPPSGVGFRDGGLNAWRDWQEFSEFRMTDSMLAVNRIIKENDPHRHPTTANICVGHGVEGHLAFIRMSEVCKALDIMGYSYYTVAHGECRSLTPFLKAMQVDSFRWYSREKHRRTLVLETEAGPNLYMITEAQRRLNNWLAVGHNAKSIVCWNYRSRISDNQVGNFNLMAWDGSPTRRAKHHAGMAKVFNRHARLINNCFPKPGAGVLVADGLTRLAFATHVSAGPGYWNHAEMDQVFKSRKGAFKLLWDMNIAADGLAEHNLDDIGKYAVVLLPMIENMTPEIADILRKYVASGGTLVAESPFAFKDENNFLSGHAPIYGLDKVFGARTRDREGRESAPDVVYPDGARSNVFFLWHAYELITGKAVASYADGRAAIVENRFGRGKAIIAGTEVFRQYLDKPEDATAAFLRRTVLESGARRTAQVIIDGKALDATGVEICRLEGKHGIIYIALNHNEAPVTFRLKIRGSGKGWFDLETGKAVVPGGEITLPPLGVLAFARSTRTKK